MYTAVEHANLSDAFYTRVNCVSDRHAQKGLWQSAKLEIMFSGITSLTDTCLDEKWWWL